MTRDQLEHIIRACADITKHYEFVVLGSQAILGADPSPPAVFTVSMEADIYPRAAPELAEAIEGAIATTPTAITPKVLIRPSRCYRTTGKRGSRFR